MEEFEFTGEFVDGALDEPVEEQAEPTGTIVVPLSALKTIGDAPSGQEILNVCIATAVFLSEKNAAYGDSALNPIRVFSKAGAVEQILVRMDDKINRLAKGHQYADEDTLQDLLGYLVLYFVAKGRNN